MTLAVKLLFHIGEVHKETRLVGMIQDLPAVWK
jgi:hypothetical protein